MLIGPRHPAIWSTFVHSMKYKLKSTLRPVKNTVQPMTGCCLVVRVSGSKVSECPISLVIQVPRKARHGNTTGIRPFSEVDPSLPAKF